MRTDVWRGGVDGSRACGLGTSCGGYMIDWMAGQITRIPRCFERHGVPAKLLRFPDESHSVSKPLNSILGQETVLDVRARWTR